jgi:hypothetical protein
MKLGFMYQGTLVLARRSYVWAVFRKPYLSLKQWLGIFLQCRQMARFTKGLVICVTFRKVAGSAFDIIRAALIGPVSGMTVGRRTRHSLRPSPLPNSEEAEGKQQCFHCTDDGERLTAT